MTLIEYFESKPRGAKAKMAHHLGITKTWMSLIINEHRMPSPEMCVAIEKLTKGAVQRSILRPDIFGEIK